MLMTALLIARLSLALVLLVAGLAKLADRSGTRRAIADFGVPGWLATPLAILLPLAELGVGAALLPAVTAWWAALGALALFLLFIGAIGANLARGRRPDCRCFGQVHSSPVGWTTIARNAALGGVAGFVLWQGPEGAGPSAVAWMGDRGPAELAAVVAAGTALTLLALLGWVLLNLLRQNGRLLLRIEALEERLDAAGIEGSAPAAEASHTHVGLPVGAPAPIFTLTGLHGETLTLEFLRAAGKPVMLVFTDPNCGPCTALLPELGRWQGEHAAHLTIVPVSRGTMEDNRGKSAEHGLTNVLVQADNEVAEAYGSPGTPSGVIVNPDGTIGSSVAGGAEAIRALVGRMVGGPVSLPVLHESPARAAGGGNGNGAPVGAHQHPVVGVGDRAPALNLPDLSGRRVNLADLRGRKTLLLFWNTSCGFCQQMLEDLRAWEANPPKGAPKLLVVSTGTVEENRAMGLRSTIVLDEGFSAGSTFGANGTPSGVLLDAKGRVASELAVGAPAVLALAGLDSPSTQPRQVRVGEAAPEVRLPDLDGNVVDLAGFRGRKTIVLFWNPGCGFCQQMLEGLKAWEAKPANGAPKLLIVSTGSVEANRQQGFRAPVVLDEGFTVGNSFGANGTPMAVLVDEKGRIASEVAAGAPAVMSLIESREASRRAVRRRQAS
jgi:peroxiredoxin/uncharacterized membrane protein YphA (DoxX/SURF4 family)